MEKEILAVFKEHADRLATICNKVRGYKDEHSVNVSAAVAMLIGWMFILNKELGGDQRTQAVIDLVIERFSEILDEGRVQLRVAILDPQVLEEAKKMLDEAGGTNTQGAMYAIFNARVKWDLALMEAQYESHDVKSIEAATIVMCMGLFGEGYALAPLAEIHDLMCDLVSDTGTAMAK